VEVITNRGRTIMLAIDDATMASEARWSAAELAVHLGFDETQRGKLAIVVTEAATNLSKHAKDGEIVIQGLQSGTISGVDILSLDRGPGMDDVDRCRADGYSKAGSLGAGLGAMARLSAFFDIHSLVGVGTVSLARLWAEPVTQRIISAGMEFGATCVPMAGEEVCGDSWCIEDVEGRVLVLVVDGLGHGPQAADAAREAVRIFRNTAALGPAEVIRAADAALRSSRGAALAVARIDSQRGEVQFAGIGNISGAIVNPVDLTSRTSMVSHNGTVGHAVRKIQEFIYPWAPNSLLVMHSDGLGTHWQLSRYAELATCHPGLVAGALYRDFRRSRDDATIVVVREGETR
jgi:anti-sigma regulatory factor (Ser/Thr protein kinase)